MDLNEWTIQDTYIISHGTKYILNHILGVEEYYMTNNISHASYALSYIKYADRENVYDILPSITFPAPDESAKADMIEIIKQWYKLKNIAE